MCEKINDFGQKIGGARKDVYAETKEYVERFSASANVDALQKAKSLSDLVKLPNLEKLVKAGAINPEQARAILTIWRSIERRPTRYYRVDSWVSSTAPKLAKIATLLSDATIDEEIRLMAEYRVLEAAEWPIKPFSFGKYSVCYFTNSYCAKPKPTDTMRIVGGGYYRGVGSTDPALISIQIAQLTTEDNGKRSEGPAFVASCNRANRWYIHPYGKDEICIRLLPEGIERGEIRRILSEEREELLSAYSEIKNVPELRREWNRPRIGQDWRKGMDVNPDLFSQGFPFRGVEFGNWVNQTERAALLNSAYDGFYDLAQVLGISHEAISLSGSLAFAFASRGIGGKNGGAAHYEPGKRVINLTKKKGAGCMAHEWFHAVDHFATGYKGYATKGSGDPQIATVGKALYGAIKNTDFFERSSKMASLTGDYWLKPEELAARGFEAVVAYLLKKSGICSDFLVNCLSMDEFTQTDNLHRSDHYPYPTEFEAAVLTPYYMDLLKLVFGNDSCNLDVDIIVEIGKYKIVAEQEQKESEKKRAAKEKAIREAKAAAAEKNKETSRAMVEDKAQKIAKEIGNGWYHVFFHNGEKAYAIGGNNEFVFMVYSNAHVAFRLISENNRIQKTFRATRRCFIEVKKGTNLRDVLEKAASLDFCRANQEFYELFENSSLSTFDEFCQQYAKFISEEREKRSKALRQDLKGDKVEQTKTQTHKNEECSKNNQNDAPHESLSLKEMDGGVYVDGSSRATYYNRREIKAHGAKWNKDSQRWEATTPESIAQLYEWFRMKAS